MARKYIKVYFDFLEAVEPLSYGERGRLITVMLQHAQQQELDLLTGGEKFLWPQQRGQIDRDIEGYEKKVAQCTEAGARGGLAKKASASGCKRTLQNASERKQTLAKPSEDKDQDKDKDQDTNPPLPPMGEQLRPAVEEWLAYKAEKRQAYKPAGRKALLSQIRNQVAKHGESAVVSVIQQSMSANYQGIVWDRLTLGGKPGKAVPEGQYVQRTYDPAKYSGFTAEDIAAIKEG